MVIGFQQQLIYTDGCKYRNVIGCKQQLMYTDGSK